MLMYFAKCLTNDALNYFLCTQKPIFKAIMNTQLTFIYTYLNAQLFPFIQI